MSKLDEQDRKDISTQQFAFPKQRKEPLEDASHVRTAIARFNQDRRGDGRRARRGLETHSRGSEEV